MTTLQQVKALIESQDADKKSDLQQLHKLITGLLSKGKLWYDDGKNDQQKTVTNPTIGYGSFVIKYADGNTKECFQLGISPNSAGISVYILGIKDKTYLPTAYSKTIGKAKVTGYCIRFKKLADINTAVLSEAIRYGVKDSATS
ncbi:MAG: DUF1801 domain-containing protein [Chitinophagaceae bacterium]|nr:MAG: DUF1801 domain-containing protein [Chitinophagaceae bacterium]